MTWQIDDNPRLLWMSRLSRRVRKRLKVGTRRRLLNIAIGAQSGSDDRGFIVNLVACARQPDSREVLPERLDRLIAVRDARRCRLRQHRQQPCGPRLRSKLRRQFTDGLARKLPRGAA